MEDKKKILVLSAEGQSSWKKNRMALWLCRQPGFRHQHPQKC